MRCVCLISCLFINNNQSIEMRDRRNLSFRANVVESPWLKRARIDFSGGTDFGAYVNFSMVYYLEKSLLLMGLAILKFSE